MRSLSNRRARKNAQLMLPLSWPDSPANGGEKTQADGGANRYRPANDDCPFAQARGYIPALGVAPYRGKRPDQPKRVK